MYVKILKLYWIAKVRKKADSENIYDEKCMYQM